LYNNIYNVFYMVPYLLPDMLSWRFWWCCRLAVQSYPHKLPRSQEL
jgi:hypothetical protein